MTGNTVFGFIFCIDIAVLLNFGFIHRTLMGVIDDYFDGYYSEEMIESQVLLAINLPFCIYVPFTLARHVNDTEISGRTLISI
jgi:hypothetical protein